MYDQVCSCSIFLSLFDIHLCFCVDVLWTGDLYLFCKGADSAIFPRVISGKVDQVRARVEHNAVVRTHRNTLTFPNVLILSKVIISIVTTGCRSVAHDPLVFPVFYFFFFPVDGSSMVFNQIHFLWHFVLIKNLTNNILLLFYIHITPAAFVMTIYNFWGVIFKFNAIQKK